MEQFQIKKLRLCDIREAMNIAAETGLSFWSEADYRAELDLPEAITLRLASPQAGCVGFLIARKVPGEQSGWDGELYNIGVRPDLQRKGGGRLLMNEFLRISATHNLRNIWLDVRASNRAAVAFYESFGFAVAGSRRGFYSEPKEDSLIMRLRLNGA